MKLNRKIIIPAATLLIGVALAGSATSTIAWYQYSTKASVAYLGTSIGTKGNLKVRIFKGENNVEADWKSFINYNDVNAFLGNKKIKPVTPGKLGKDEALPTPEDSKPFYANPVAGFGPLEQWLKADAASYVQIPLQFKFVESDGSKDGNGNYIEKQIAKDLYLSDLLIQNDYQNANNAKRDLSSAVRVHFEAYQTGSSTKVNHLVSKNGGETATVGNLDLDNIPGDDKTYTAADEGAQYGFGESPTQKGTLINYGAKEGVATADNKQVSYMPSEVVDLKKLGSTSATDGVYLNVNVTIWLEGWQQLPKASNTDTATSSIWDYASTIDSLFDVGMEFVAKDAQ